MDWHWFLLVVRLAPVVLALVPGAAPLAPLVDAAIRAAEALPAASSTEKLAHAQQLVIAGVAAANAAAGHTVLNPDIAEHVAANVISTIVDTANRIHQAHAPQPTLR